MTSQIAADRFKTQLFDLLEETFERVQGIYLDRGTSLFETLETISAEQASRPVSARCACIAAHVEHMCYYLRVLESSITGQEFGIIDWEGSWQLQHVTSEEWGSLQQDLKDAYQSVLTTMKGLETWEGEDDIGASLAILAHTAYHLGEIRQALCVVD